MITLKIAYYCAEEVRRQGRGPIQVAWMLNAWEWAMDGEEAWKDVLFTVRMLGSLVEREANSSDEWRYVGVRVGMRVCPSPEDVPDLMKRWAEHLEGMTPEEAYKEFEEIHPFRDGNGRVGKIIYNWRKGTLQEPEWPPNFWNVSNP